MTYRDVRPFIDGNFDIVGKDSRPINLYNLGRVQLAAVQRSKVLKIFSISDNIIICLDIKMSDLSD